jgi:O-antigen ligase
MTWSLDQEPDFGTVTRMGLGLIFAILIWEFAVTYRQQLWPLRSLLIGMLVPLYMMFASFLGAYHMEWENETVQFTGGGHDQNYIAMMFANGIVVAVYFATSPGLDRRLPLVYWRFSALAAIAAMLTGSRSGFVCLVLAAIFAALLVGLSRRRMIQSACVLGLILFVFAMSRYVVPMALQARATDFSLESGGLATRLAYWQRGLTVSFPQNPLAGIGAGGYAPVTTALTGTKTATAHNNIILVLVELGIVGLLIYLGMLYSTFRGVWSLPRREKILWSGILLIWFVESMAISSLTDKLAWFLLAMAACQAAAAASALAGQRRLARRSVGLQHPPQPRTA